MHLQSIDTSPASVYGLRCETDVRPGDGRLRSPWVCNLDQEPGSDRPHASSGTEAGAVPTAYGWFLFRRPESPETSAGCCVRASNPNFQHAGEPLAAFNPQQIQMGLRLEF